MFLLEVLNILMQGVSYSGSDGQVVNPYWPTSVYVVAN